MFLPWSLFPADKKPYHQEDPNLKSLPEYFTQCSGKIYQRERSNLFNKERNTLTSSIRYEENNLLYRSQNHNLKIKLIISRALGWLQDMKQQKKEDSSFKSTYLQLSHYSWVWLSKIPVSPNAPCLNRLKTLLSPDVLTVFSFPKEIRPRQEKRG